MMLYEIVTEILLNHIRKDPFHKEKLEAQKNALKKVCADKTKCLAVNEAQLWYDTRNLVKGNSKREFENLWKNF